MARAAALIAQPREGTRMPLKGPKLEKFKQRLLAKRKELISEVRGSNVGSLETSTDGIQDIADQASSAYTKEFLLSIGDAERRMLRQVDEALAKIRQDTYGRCESCGEMISERRLEALPFARLCIACQEEEERAKARS
ncbi:MAG: TraR/DksA family transcriptional regulator [candidate division NC10 bacterium]|nr:TraR/DksA family transcriptional regulator [candidate division NC10 bacterium]MBI4841696.1 TraR/DksA family transcriptional regulator [candidate division NC10 bacterium]